MKIDMRQMQAECEQARRRDAEAAKVVFDKVLSNDDKIIAVCSIFELFKTCG